MPMISVEPPFGEMFFPFSNFFRHKQQVESRKNIRAMFIAWKVILEC